MAKLTQQQLGNGVTIDWQYINNLRLSLSCERGDELG